MALVSLKSFLFPRKQQTPTTANEAAERQRLRPDVERQGSFGSTATTATAHGDHSGPNFVSDKASQPGANITLLRYRIDPRTISDATIGLSDGLTVPFALTAGLSALGTTQLVVYAGFAELVAGAISMGLGGYLGAKGEADGYFAALEETRTIVREDEARACAMVRDSFRHYDLRGETVEAMLNDLLGAGEEAVVGFVMRFHHQLAEADFKATRAYASGLTIALGYFIGGLIPLLPYLFFERVGEALYCSVLVMALALFVFGWVKTALVGESSRLVCLQNAVQMLVLGGLAAGAAMGCVKAIGG